jgi:hypothetical protein
MWIGRRERANGLLATDSSLLISEPETNKKDILKTGGIRLTLWGARRRWLEDRRSDGAFPADAA